MGASIRVDTHGPGSVGIYFGHGKLDQAGQGKFNTNYLVCISGHLIYVFWTVRKFVYLLLERGFLIPAMYAKSCSSEDF